MTRVDVLRVFVDEAGGFGNLLGVVDGPSVPPARRQQVAAELGYSETVFVDDREAGRIQIFTPSVELPFAGHPTVGTAWWLRAQGYDAPVLQVPAGEITVTRDGEITRVRARGEWTPRFDWFQLDDQEAVLAADPAAYPGDHSYVWSWTDETKGSLRSRMFAPAMGIVEDEATGAAAVALTTRLERDLDITQGAGSRIATTWEGNGWATVGGRVVHDGERTVSP